MFNKEDTELSTNNRLNPDNWEELEVSEGGYELGEYYERMNNNLTDEEK